MVVQETFVPNHQRGANKTSLMKLCDLARDLDLDKDFGLLDLDNPFSISHNEIVIHSFIVNRIALQLVQRWVWWALQPYRFRMKLTYRH